MKEMQLIIIQTNLGDIHTYANIKRQVGSIPPLRLCLNVSVTLQVHSVPTLWRLSKSSSTFHYLFGHILSHILWYD